MLKDRKNLWLLVWPAGMIIYAAARFSPFIAEYVFARGVYRVYGTVMSFITGWLPFSLAEWLLIAVPAAFAIWIVVSVFNIIINKEARVTRALNLVRGILVVPGVIFLWFMIGAGTNYYRYEFSSFSGLEIQKSTVDELHQLCRELVLKTNQAREEAVSSQQVFISSYSNRERGRQAHEAMKKLAEKYPVMKGYYPYYKPVFFSRVMSRFEITGVYFPWTVESNVNVDIPDYTIGATVCHELSHLRGFMREDEANYISYLACVGSDSPELKYSGYMLALTYSLNSLNGASPILHYQVVSCLSEGVLEDMREHNRYWKQFENTVYSEAGEKMNDTYLKANNQTDGTFSYGRMVDLLLAEQRASKTNE
ncbi:MAG: DUF3810 domain-containing protein [Lachnospiraceae bacterium]|nr:DUF3810 domain-containing protein [Lachnospiraceae bacterium]